MIWFPMNTVAGFRVLHFECWFSYWTEGRAAKDMPRNRPTFASQDPVAVHQGTGGITLVWGHPCKLYASWQAKGPVSQA